MKVEILCLCDFATVDVSSKMTVVGAFDTVYGHQPPVVNGLCALAVRLRFDKVEEGVKKLRISFTDIDGRLIMPSMEPQVPVQVLPGSPTAIAQIVLILTLLPLPNFGEYSIDLAVDGRQEASIPLYARQAQPIPPHLQKPPQS